MTAATVGQYERAAQAVLAACHQWAAANPGARLRFQPMLPPGDQGGAIMSLKCARLVHNVAGNSTTRRLLEAMDRAVTDCGGATVLMAEAALYCVYKLPSALTMPRAS